MFIGHLPAGYLLTSGLLSPTDDSLRQDRRLLALGLAASVAPDIDLFWFYLVDARRDVHHAYWPHLPAFWLGVFGVVAMGLALCSASRWSWVALGIIAANVALHLVLDTIAGGVEWLVAISECRVCARPRHCST